MKKILYLVFFLLCGPFLDAQESEPKAPIIFIFDASGSMWGQIDGKPKISIATNVMNSTVSKLDKKQAIGLVVYGHRREADCTDVEFLLDPRTGNSVEVTSALGSIKPLGRTPLAASALQVIERLTSENSEATIILITDGIESCGGNICDVIIAAKKKGIKFRLHIIGFGLQEDETEQLKCAAKAGEGNYYDAGDAGQLSTGLEDATHQTIEKVRKNVSVYALTNGKPIDAYIKAISEDGVIHENAARTYKDTGFLYLPPGIYDLEIRPLAGSDLNPITLKNIRVPEKGIIHNSVSFDGGKLQVYVTNNDEGWDAVVNVYNVGTKIRAGATRTYGRTQTLELNPGEYDITYRALRLEGLELDVKHQNITVVANQTTEVFHNYKSGTAIIGAMSDNKRIDVTVKIVEKNSGQNVGGGRTYTGETTNPATFLLNPGTYDITLTGLGNFKGQKKYLAIEVKAGETITKTANF